MSTPEARFAAKVKKILDGMIKNGEPLYYFVKEAASIRGLPDIVMCYNGFFYVWELKPSQYEAEKTSGRIVLQRYTLQRIAQAQGRGAIVHPENLEQELSVLIDTCTQQQKTKFPSSTLIEYSEIE